MSHVQQVHLRINDAATGQPAPVRLCINGALANHRDDFYMPLGRPSVACSVPLLDVGGMLELDRSPSWDAWAYIDGACEIELPCDEPLHLRATKGPEYVPLNVAFQLTAGKLALRHEIRRWNDFRRAGWYSADTRVHVISPHAALLEAQAEDLAIVQILIREFELPQELANPPLRLPGSMVQLPDHSPPAVVYPNMLAFSGQAPCLERSGHRVVVNTENFHRALGSLGLLHCHRVVYPLSFGRCEHDNDDWTLLDWCGQCHRKNGLVIWTRTDHGCADFEYGEPLVDLLLGEVDAFEITDDARDVIELWYDLLNIGLRVPLAGASGKESNGQLLGAMRTYVKLGETEDLTCGAWIEGLRAGLSFVTNGPLVEFTVNDRQPGSVVAAAAGKLRVVAEAKSWHPFERLEIVCGGVSVASAAAQLGPPAHAAVEIDAPVERSGWIAARCSGKAFAHTSPVYLDVGDRPPPPDRAAAARLLGEVERMIVWCQTKARCTTPQARERLVTGFLKARERLATLATT